MAKKQAARAKTAPQKKAVKPPAIAKPKKPAAKPPSSEGAAISAFVRTMKEFVSGTTKTTVVVGETVVALSVSWYEQNPDDGSGVIDNQYTMLEGTTLGELMLDAARRWPGELNVLKITCQAKGARARQDEILGLARAAWCEAFGVKAPDQESVADQRSSEQSRLLALLGQGKAGINEWNALRGKPEKPNPEWAVSDFTGVNLSGSSLPGVCFLRLKWVRGNLSKADLSSAVMDGIDLTGAKLVDANLTKASLCAATCGRADFTRAQLAGAQLGFSKLRGAKFCHADLRGADFMQAELVGADFTDAKLDKATFAGARFDETTQWPAGRTIPANAKWKGKGADPRQSV